MQAYPHVHNQQRYPHQQETQRRIGRSRACPHLLHYAIACLYPKASPIAPPYSDCLASHTQADIQQPAQFSPARPSALIGSYYRHRHTQATVFGTPQCIAGSIALASTTQFATTALLASDRHGDDCRDVLLNQIAQYWDGAETLVGKQALDRQASTLDCLEQTRENRDLAHSRLDKHHRDSQAQIALQHISSRTAIETGGAIARFTPTDPRIRLVGV